MKFKEVEQKTYWSCTSENNHEFVRIQPGLWLNSTFKWPDMNCVKSETLVEMLELAYAEYCHPELRSKLDQILVSFFGSKELAETWWNGHNLYFGGKTPNQVFSEQPKDVADYIYRICK